MNYYMEGLSQVQALIFDVDGVLSTENFIISKDGSMMRSMNIKDGYAIQYAAKKGFHIAIISGGSPEGITERFSYLGVKDIVVKAKDKKKEFTSFLQKYSLTPEHVLYMGDDIPDYEVMKVVGMPVCPCDAVEEIRSISKYISPVKGGCGCARDIIEKVLKSQGKWLDEDAYLW